MPQKITAAEATYYLGFDGGGTKTECVLADSEGNILSKASAGASNPLRAGYTKAWFSLSEAADLLLSRQKITASHIRGLCAGLGGASRTGVGRRAVSFFEYNFPNAQVRVTSDLEIALEAAFGSGEGIVLLGGTGSASLGRDAHGRTMRVGGRGPWFSDEGSAYDIGRQAVRAVSLAEEKRGPATALSKRLFAWNECRDWESLMDRVAKSPDDVFPRTFPLVAQVADAGDEVARNILERAAGNLADLAMAVARELGWLDRPASIAKVGGVFGRSKYFDEAIEVQVKRALPQAHLMCAKISPAEAAVQIAIRLTCAKGNAA
jgi:glucosamine kinase